MKQISKRVHQKGELYYTKKVIINNKRRNKECASPILLIESGIVGTRSEEVGKA